MVYFKHIVLFIFFFSNGFLFAEENHLSLITDRDVYVSGEIALVKVYLPVNNESKVVYLDLISRTGKHIDGAKLSVEDQEAEGFIIIPDSLSSGSCLLKVFTNRNRDCSFLLKELLIINRFELNREHYLLETVNLPANIRNDLGASFSTVKEKYSKREDVQINVDLDDKLIENLEGDLLISITEYADNFKAGWTFIEDDSKTKKYLEESKGIIIQGKVTEKSTSSPAKDVIVSISKPDSIPFFDYYKTNDDGRFYFLLKDFYGETPLIIKAGKDGENEDLKISIDKKFDDTFIDLALNKTVQAGGAGEFISKSAKLVTFKRIFGSTEYLLEKRNWKKQHPYPFYGKPVIQVDPDLFFDMKDFNELSREILPTVKFRENDGSFSVRMFNDPLIDFFADEPLMLLDGVPFYNVELLANLKPNKIDWIDVIPRERFYGDLRFQGVLAIYTKERDASKIIASDQLLKLSYEGFQNKISLSQDFPADTNIPDFRQVLLWEPKLKPKKRIPLSFRTSDVKGTYHIRVYGKTKSGGILESVKTFKVD